MRRRRFRKPRHSPPEDINPLVRLWLLRILVPLGGHRGFIERHGYHRDSLATALGLPIPEEEDSAESGFDRTRALRELRRLHAAAESFDTSRTSDHLSSNCQRLKGLLGLSEADRRILEFATLINTDTLLDDTADYLGNLSSLKVASVLSQVLHLPLEDVRAALHPKSVLARSGLVNVNKTSANTLRCKLDLLSDAFASRMIANEQEPVELLRDVVAPGRPPQLTLDDFAHIRGELNILQPFLRASLHARRPGVNVFIHGDPGTGKTQLARVLGKDLGCEVFEVASEDEDGDPTTGEKRLQALRAAHSFFGGRRALIVFDECEDVFNDESFSRKSTAQARKGWMNRLLEENPLPTIWLSNDVACMDRAFIRRYDFVFELDIPPRRQRERIIVDSAKEMLEPETARRLAAAENLAPAVVTRAVSVVQAIEESMTPQERSRAVERLVENTLVAQGHVGLAQSNALRLPDLYDPAFVNADADLAKLAEGIVHARTARICLYGPPGTGKSAYARWVADQLGRDVLLRRASDIISPWLGMTERNLARAFRKADKDNAVLVIDEVDTFLQDRRKAQRSWEVAEVNEMLTQMESFGGVFFATTNLADGLDQAALRRFDLKAKFGYLRPEQAWRLFVRQCGALGIADPAAELRIQLARLAVLTPGDFAAVARQHRFRPIGTAQGLYEALVAECEVKEDGRKRAVGFV